MVERVSVRRHDWQYQQAHTSSADKGVGAPGPVIPDSSPFCVSSYCSAIAVQNVAASARRDASFYSNREAEDMRDDDERSQAIVGGEGVQSVEVWASRRVGRDERKKTENAKAREMD